MVIWFAWLMKSHGTVFIANLSKLANGNVLSFPFSVCDGIVTAMKIMGLIRIRWDYTLAWNGMVRQVGWHFDN